MLFGGAAAGKTRKDEHTLDVVAAALEAPTYLAGHNAGRREPTNSTFEGSEVPEIIHELPYRLGRAARRYRRHYGPRGRHEAVLPAHRVGRIERLSQHVGWSDGNQNALTEATARSVWRNSPERRDEQARCVGTG
jgi:hypothetical protein